VARNLALSMTALLLAFPTAAREMHALDVVTVLAVSVMAALMYGTVNQLVVNSASTSRRV